MDEITYDAAYRRVLPRDLFNEASLLKCLGRLWILLEDTPGDATLGPDEVESFEIGMDMSSGNLSVVNLNFRIGGVTHTLERPLNSREAWPLYVSCKAGDVDFEEVSVFDEAGNFSGEMRELIGLS